MIRALAGMVTGGVELLEAEGRLARLHLVRAGSLLVALLACALAVGIFIPVIGAGVIVLLAERIGLGPALIWTGAVGVILGVGVAAAAWSGFRAGDAAS